MTCLRNLLITTQRNLPKDSILHKIWGEYLPPSIRSRVWRYLAAPGTGAPEYLQALDRIGHELDNYIISVQPEKSIRVLYGPSFSIHSPSFIHDRILSYALRLRGAEIIPIYCDAIQSVECNVYGGMWGGGTKFKRNCENCVDQSQKLWRPNPGPASKLSQYLKRSEIKTIAMKVVHLSADSWIDYVEDGLPFGRWAKDILVNNYVVGDYHLVPDYHALGLAHLKNLLLLRVAYQRIIDNVEPDCVISNDSYYGMWAILENLCKRKEIPFYSHWSGTRRSAWCYAYNDAAMNLDFSQPWQGFSQIPMNERQKDKVQTWLKGRTQGEEMIFDTASLATHLTDESKLTSIDLIKPTALLAANVIWDLSALNKQIVFADMIDWIAQTIEWFTVHPEFQLIIKPHPAELNPSIPQTEERIEVGLLNRKVDLPSNVILLSPRAELKVYDLFPLIKVGLVYTTTTGLEMAGIGLPVITSAKAPYRGFGFTLDPVSKDDYFNILYRSLSGEKILDLETQRDLSWKFILFNFFHYYSKIDILDFKFGEIPRLKIKSLVDLLPGSNKHLDYILDSIIDGQPILSETCWPPES